MFDRWTARIIQRPLQAGAQFLHRLGIRPDTVTVCGFAIGMAALPALALGWYLPAFGCIVLCRIADGLDGSLARLSAPTDAGGYLDIVLDFIFYSAVVFGFALADSSHNSLAAAALIFSFIGSGCSFLSFAIMAERRGLKNVHYPRKGLYYLGGLTEGTETICFFVLVCLFPTYFPTLAWVFAAMCWLTTITRLIGGYRTIRADEQGGR
jgi:phosphatidylglycerophosphate synthase